MIVRRAAPAPSSAPRSPIWRLGVLGAVLIGLTLAALSLHRPGMATVGTPELKVYFVGLLALAGLAYFASVRTVLSGVPSWAVWVVVGVALAVRAGPLIAPPFLSSDVYRYVWDGFVQASGINPYVHIPADPALAPLRDTAVFPLINRAATAPTIYPPAAQAIFAAAGWAFPLNVTAVKAVMVGFEAVAIGVVWAVLARSGAPPAGIVIWAWNPLAIWAFAGNGHIDAAAVGLLAVTLLLASVWGGALAGMAFGAAVLTKFLPLAVAPALWPLGRWRVAGATILTAAALYACYAGAGWRVLGFLSGYGDEEGYADGRGFWLLAGLSWIAPLPAFAGKLYQGLAAAALASLAVWIAFVARPRSDAAIWRAAGWLMAAVTVAVSPHYPWYFVWLALPAAVVPSRALIWLATAPVLLYLDPWNERFVWPSIVYLPAFALAFADRLSPLRFAPSVPGVSACPPRL